MKTSTLLKTKASLREALHHELHSFSQATEKDILLDKIRTILTYTKRDQRVVEPLALILKETIEPTLKPCLYSYRKNRGPLLAVKKAASIIKKAYKKNPQPQLYIIKRDVKKYTDSIPLTEDSYLWSYLLQLHLNPFIFQNIKNALKVDTQIHQNREQGIPMGVAFTPWIANGYLTQFDNWAAQSTSGIYLRYGDDLLWMTPHYEEAEQIIRQIPEELKKYSLNENNDKKTNLFLCSHGTLPSSLDDSWRAQSHFTYLGREITHRGLISISGEKRSQLLKDLRKRLYHLKATLKSSELSESSQQELKTELSFNVLSDFLNKGWKSSDRFYPKYKEINDPGTLRSLRIDFFKTLALSLYGKHSGYELRKLKLHLALRRYHVLLRGLSPRSQ